MTDTTRESVERLMQDCALAEKVMKDGDIFLTGQAIFADATKTLAALLTRAEAAEARSYALAVAIMGGEDAPGYADSIDTDTLTDQLRKEREGKEAWVDTCVGVAKEEARAERDALAAKLALAVEALEKLHHAVCGETGFSECVRRDSGKVYPWPALDIADSLAQTALAKLTADTPKEVK